MNKSVKFYEFAEESKLSKNSNIFFSGLLITFLPLIVYLIIKTFLTKTISNVLFPQQLNLILILMCLILGFVLTVLYNKSSKGILLYDCFLKIETNFVLKHYFFKINPQINYSEIKSVSIESKKSGNYEKWNEKHLYFVAGYYSKKSDYIRIETVDNSIYCFCVKTQEEFVEELVERVNNYRQQRNMKEL